MQYVTIDIPYVTISDTFSEGHDIETHVLTPFGNMDIVLSIPTLCDKDTPLESVIKVETGLPNAACLNSIVLEGFAETVFAFSFELARKALRAALSKNFRIELKLVGPQHAIQVWRRSDSSSWEVEAAEIPASE